MANASEPMDSYSIKAPQAKKMVLKAIREGKKIEQAMELVGKSARTYDYYMKDPEFKRAVELIRAKVA